MKKKVILTFAMLLGLSGGAIGVSAASVSVGGGTWNYGVGITGSYSDYYHPSKTHTASVHSSGGGQKDTDRAYAGQWAKARVSVWDGCSFYWNVE